MIDEGSIAQPVKAPADAVKTFGGLEITTASTQLQELTDAVIYLVNYPYSCSEQTASRIIAIAALKDVLTAFKSRDMPSPEALRDYVDSDLKYLQGLQNEDGGFGFWRKGEHSFPYVSVHVAHALVRAKSKGFAVSEAMLNNSQEYLARRSKRRFPANTALNRDAQFKPTHSTFAPDGRRRPGEGAQAHCGSWRRREVFTRIARLAVTGCLGRCRFDAKKRRPSAAT